MNFWHVGVHSVATKIYATFFYIVRKIQTTWSQIFLRVNLPFFVNLECLNPVKFMV
jgi:hypothetical protein